MTVVCGNAEVIALLEQYLQLAKENRFGIAGVMIGSTEGAGACDWAGNIMLEPMLAEGISLLRNRVKESIDNWRLPEQDPSLGADYVRYNVTYAPLGFDFLTWLVDQEMTRRRAEAPAPLKVGFWMGKDPEWKMNRDVRRHWLDKVFRPCLPLIGAVEDERAVYGQGKQIYVGHDITRAHRSGERVPMLKSTKPSPMQGRYITVTLRETQHYPERNSNVHAWLKFADTIRGKHRVIFVRDTIKAQEPLYGFETCPEASINLDDRMALYSAAEMNFFVSNGPVGLTIFSEYPWTAFITVQDDPREFNEPEFWEKANDVKVGEQFPWSGYDQRIVWKPDTFENIMDAWRCHCESYRPSASRRTA